MAEDPDGDQGRSRETRLLAELPGGRLLRPFAGLDLPAREFPQPPQETPPRPALDQRPSVRDDHRHRRAHVRARGRTPTPRDRPGVGELRERSATEPDGTVGTRRDHRPADRLPELHHRLVELPRRRWRQQSGQDASEPLPDGRGPEVPLLPDPPRGHSETVRFQGHDRGRVGEARHRPGDVGSDAGQRLPSLDRGRPRPAPAPRHDPGRRVEVSRPGVVPSALPHLQDVRLPGGGEGVDGREAPHKPLEVRDRLRDPGLLEQDLGDPDAVRVPVAPPGERPPMRAEPR